MGRRPLAPGENVNDRLVKPVPRNNEVVLETPLRVVAGNWRAARYGHDKPTTNTYYRHNLDLFLAWLEAQKGDGAPLSELNAENINTYAKRRKAKRSEFSARATVITLRAFANWVERNMPVTLDIAGIQNYRVDEEKRQPLNDDEVRKVLAAAQTTQLAGRDYPLTYFFLGTGMRLREVQSLRLRDVSFPSRAIMVLASNSKSGKGREVTLFDDVWAVLGAYIRAFRADAAPNDPLWVDRDGKQMSSEAIRGVGRAVRKKSGVPTFGWHICRHTYATNARKAGMDVLQLREELGHADFRTLARYSHTVPAAQRVKLPSPLGMIDLTPRGRAMNGAKASGVANRQTIESLLSPVAKKRKMTMKLGHLAAVAPGGDLSHWGVAKR